MESIICPVVVVPTGFRLEVINCPRFERDFLTKFSIFC
jgi:hypothetical protein